MTDQVHVDMTVGGGVGCGVGDLERVIFRLSVKRV